MAYQGSWVPFPGKKRTAFQANLGDDFDDECAPVPSKMCAISYEVACQMMSENEQKPPPSPPPHQNQDVPMEEDVDNGNGSGDRVQHIKKDESEGDTTNDDDKCGVNQNEDLDGKECRELVTHSKHESQPISSSRSHACNSKVLSKKDVTLVLSKEIRESFVYRKLSEDLTLRRLMSSQIPASSSMMLVEWKPKPTTAMDYLKAILSPSAKEVTRIHPSNPVESATSNTLGAPCVQKDYEENSTLSTLSTLLPVHLTESSFDTDDEKESSSRMDVDVL